MTHFHILTPAFNCANKIKTTLDSVFGQVYDDWSMTVIDDVSDDGTYDVIKNIVDSRGFSDRVDIIRRKKKYGEVRNTLDVCQNLDDETVVVRLDAGDWLTDLGCLHILDLFYKEYSLAAAWTAHRWSWTTQNISGQIDSRVSLYDQPWRTSHLKTFRVKHLRRVPKANFFDQNGKYFTIACDQAIFLPMLEILRRNNEPMMHIPLVMYHYDIDLNKPDLFHTERSYRQKSTAEFIRERGLLV